MIIGISGKMQSGKDTVSKIIQYYSFIEENEENLEYYPEDALITNLEQDHPETIDEDTVSYKDWKVVRFADKVKEITASILGCPIKKLEDPKFKETVLGEEWWYYKILTVGNPTKFILYPYLEYKDQWHRDTLVKLTPRLFMQLLGTDCGRNILHPNIWVNATMAKYTLTPDPNLTITEWKDKKSFSQKEALEYIYPSGHKYPKWIISDVRFPNEARAIKERNGVLIRVERPCPTCKKYKDSFESRYCSNPYHINSHESETALDNWKDWDYMIKNDKDLKHLVNLVKETKVWDI